MVQPTFIKVFAILALVIATGCSSSGRNFSYLGFAAKGMAVAGPEALFTDNSSIELLDMKQLFDPEDKVRGKIDGWDHGYAIFQKNYGNLPDDRARGLRNAIQERILHASEQRCGDYKTFLKRFDADSNILFGWLTTAMAGAGAIAIPANTARTLSGLAAIFSGFRAEVNEAYFNKLTVQVITQGIESKRAEIYRNILERRKTGLIDYPVQAALRDAAQYHYNCSLVSGLEHAAITLQRSEDPGLKHLKAVLGDIKDARNLASQLTPSTNVLVEEELAFPLIAFNKAKQAFDSLKKKHEEELKKLKVVDAASLKIEPVPQGLSEQEKADREKRFNELKKSIAATGEAKQQLEDRDIPTALKTEEPKFADAEKKKLEDLQGQWVTLFVQVESESNAERQIKPKAQMVVVQEEAKQKRKEYQESARGLNEKLSAAIDVIEKVNVIAQKAKEFGA